MSTNPLIALFLARRRGRGFDVVPHVHVWFGDRAGLACWRSLSETCYTFGPLAFIAKDLRSRLALALFVVLARPCVPAAGVHEQLHAAICVPLWSRPRAEQIAHRRRIPQGTATAFTITGVA